MLKSFRSLPLCAIASPSTLTTREGSRTLATTCQDVPILNFTRENGFGLFSDDGSRAGLSYWGIIGNSEQYRDDGRYIYYSPSSELHRTSQLSMLSTTGPIKPPNPCPSNTVCAYSMELAVPAYRCDSRDEFGGSNPSAYNRSQLAPTGKLLYASYSSFSEGATGTPLIWDTMNSSAPGLGVFTEIPSLWVGFVTNSLHHEPRIVECAMHDATYSYNVTFSEQMTINRTSVVLNSPLLPDNSSKAPWDDDYQQFSGFHATGYVYRKFLEGNITLSPDSSYWIDHSDITQSDLIDQTTGLPVVDDFAATLEDRFNGIFLSMLADKQLHSQTNSLVPCTVTTQVLVWRYEPFWLALPYIIAVSLTMVAVAAGAYSFHKNGYSANTSFSAFITTSRSADIDELSYGHCLGQWPTSKEISNTTLRFGEVRMQSDQAHASFGFPENVKKVDMRKKYA
ncbi:hypothetical protein F5B20DRAFT_520275 [Whalleya microplaca]|nr:hypothetical protein F5B20DRAFT_520275 [Whalleya microplaca]